MSRSSSTASGGGGGGGASEEGFIPSLMALRGRLEGGGEDHPFRWIFGADVSQVFVSESRQGRCGLEGMANVTPGGDSFEGVLFKTMGLFAMTPHVDTREATLQTLYSVLQVSFVCMNDNRSIGILVHSRMSCGPRSGIMFCHFRGLLLSLKSLSLSLQRR